MDLSLWKMHLIFLSAGILYKNKALAIYSLWLQSSVNVHFCYVCNWQIFVILFFRLSDITIIFILAQFLNIVTDPNSWDESLAILTAVWTFSQVVRAFTSFHDGGVTVSSPAPFIRILQCCHEVIYMVV